jgi:hypothetical protein
MDGSQKALRDPDAAIHISYPSASRDLSNLNDCASKNGTIAKTLVRSDAIAPASSPLRKQPMFYHGFGSYLIA